MDNSIKPQKKITGLLTKLKNGKIFSFFRKNRQITEKADYTRHDAQWAKKQNRLDYKLVASLSEKKIPTYRQLKYLPHYLTKKEKSLAQLALTVFLVSLLFVVIRIYQKVTYLIPENGGEYAEALVGTPKYVNPILSQTNDTDMDLVQLTFSGLLKLNSNQELINDLAENYEISEDQKEYTFHIRQGVKFHDGEDLNADDVIFTFDSIQDTLFKSPLYLYFKGVNVEKLDDYTIKFILPEPFTPFLSSLNFGILPEHIWSGIAPENANLADYNLKPIGSGPFKFKSLTKDKTGNIRSYELERNKDYYNKPPYLEKISFKFYPDLVSALDAVKSKKVEGISFVPQDEKAELEKRNGNISYQSLRLPQYAAVFFNQKNQLLKTAAVREALALAVDKVKIIKEALNNEGEIINGPILPGYIGYNPEIRKYNYDPASAEKTLDDAGWKYPEAKEGETPSNVRMKDGAELAFALSTTDQPEYLKTVEIIKQAWESIGVRLETKIYTSKDIQKKVIKPRAYEALLFGEIVGTDPDPYPFWHSSQSRDPGLNLAVFYNKDIDQLLEEARKTNDSEARRLKYLHFQNILADELPAIFLYNPIYTYGLDKKIKGDEGKYITVPSDRFADVENWYVKTSRSWKKPK